ncbi:CheY-like receiver, AAA-type ATPase and DNA-binding domain-containing response regulator [Desulfocapsa sulfexigens DSM 10523]|uniref:CheY-like receiver, AAA-type ATPase and DNA-binding domain-containing response regulator n=1 Tax=Desulfocapsa sulfexigens (strain DSM 10523 / SB164P1) TaxID=1167006 RepID=M1P1N4_DESSD|nr:sigma-54 dependent transcriptional regulator [Desulfocapsa sulfexigens]AGF77408.1 CheY-like receiver, AAA-type ATPase and DNA-binding domain-containing response regulator [Desulfocapsa sulfexigens DSM 10523]
MSEVDILVVDDEEVALKNLCHVLRKEGYQVVAAKSGKQALSYLEKNEFPLVLTDLKMPQVDGMQVLKRVKSLYPQTEVIMITGFSTVDSAVESLKAGAYHYITKPFKLEEVRKVVFEAVQKYQLIQEVEELRKESACQESQLQIVTHNHLMKGLLEVAKQVAGTDTNIVISGESGTGKELLAKYIHRSSPRNEQTMLSINCGAFSEELLTNELFGHSQGAFTGADQDKKGLVEMADGGTLFLDEITEMPLSMQVKFLRVLQEQEVMRVGGTKPVKVNVRFVAATNRDLEKEVRSGHFRQDLFYRINVVSLKIPPLSDRKDDIPLLVRFFLDKYNSSMRKQITEISQDVLDTLQHYDFPGNVRELENIVERGVALATGNTLGLAQIPDDLRNLDIQTFRKSAGKYASMEEVEKSYIEWILKETGFNKTEAAKALGIDRVSLWRKIKKLGLE